MGQSSSALGNPSESDNQDVSQSRRFSFRSSLAVVISSSEMFDNFERSARDFTADLPDECLALVFQLLSAGDRKRCSLVCKRWFRVDGQSRFRLSLNGQSDILPVLPSLFTRFDSVTKLALRCDRKAVSLNDDALVLISIRCSNLVRVKLRGCREITDVGMEIFSQNCKLLKKLSCCSCMFSAKAMNSILTHCKALEELSVKRLRGIQDGSELIGTGITAPSLKSVSLKELNYGQCFEPMIIGSKKLVTLKVNRCLGNWDNFLEKIGSANIGLTEIHLERLHVGDLGLSGVSKCTSLEVLRIVKTTECTDFGLISVAENCRQLRKLHIDAWKSDKIGDESLIAVAKQSLNLQELVLIGVNPTSLGLAAVASNCQKLERLALCGSGSVGDPEIACIADKCVALKKLCIKGCGISDVGIKSLAWGCPNLTKIKVKKCRGVSCEIADWLRQRRASLIVNWDDVEVQQLDSGSSPAVAQQTEIEIPQIVVRRTDPAEASSSGNASMAMWRTKFVFLAYKNLVSCAFRRCPTSENSITGNV